MSDEYQSSKVAEARAAVQASGQLESISGPEFMSTDPDISWRTFWTLKDGRPEFGKVTIQRAGQKPREVVISWDEYAAELALTDPDWLEKRGQKPMSIFGAEVERHAYNVVFADVIAAAFPPRIVAGSAPPEGWEPRDNRMMVVPDAEAAVRDWIADVTRAASGEALNGLYDEAKSAGALAKVDGLQAAFMERMLDLEHPKPKPPRPFADQLAPKGNPRRRRGGKPRP